MYWSTQFAWLRDTGTKKIRVEVCGALRNVVLGEKGEGKMARKKSNNEVSEKYRKREDASKQNPA
jgi:hypothetical protein